MALYDLDVASVNSREFPQKHGFSLLLFGNPGLFAILEAVEILVEIAGRPCVTTPYEAILEGGHVLGRPPKGRIIKNIPDVNGP